MSAAHTSSNCLFRVSGSLYPTVFRRVAAPSSLGGQRPSTRLYSFGGEGYRKSSPVLRAVDTVAVVRIHNRNFPSPRHRFTFVHDHDFEKHIVRILNIHSDACLLGRQVVSALRFNTPDLVFNLTIFAQQNDELGSSVFPVFKPSQLGAFPCEEGCSFLVLLDFAAIRYTEDRILLVHGNNWNLLEEFYTIKCRYLWDEREHRRPLVLVVILVL